MKKRWLYYILVGVLFGVFDFYFQTWINQVGGLNAITMLVPILGVWLVPVVPIAFYEAKTSRSIWLAAAASVCTWSISVVAYYLYMGVKLILIGQENRAEMHISNRNTDPYYWSNFKSFFEGDFWGGVSEWILVALVGGCLVGLLVGFLTLRFRNTAQV